MQVACLRCHPARKPLRRFSTLRRFPPFLPCRTPVRSISDTHPVDIGHRSGPNRTPFRSHRKTVRHQPGRLSDFNRNTVRFESERCPTSNRIGVRFASEYACKTIDFKGKLDDPRYRHQQTLFVIAAHLGTQQYRRTPQQLSDYCLELTVKLYNEGYSPSEVHLLHRLIDWLIPLPDDLKIQFRKQLQQRLPKKTMAHITLFEELALKEGLEKGIQKGLVEGRQKGRQEGRQKGRQEGLVEGLEKGIVQTARESILDVLDTRFGQVPASVRERINALCSEPKLKDLLRRAVRTPSIEEFQATL